MTILVNTNETMSQNTNRNKFKNRAALTRSLTSSTARAYIQF